MVFVQALKDAIDAATLVLIVLVAGARRRRGAPYARAEPVRSFLSVLTPAPLVFLVLFLFISPVSDIVTRRRRRGQVGRGRLDAPVVMLVSRRVPRHRRCMDAEGKIDAKRYPGLRASWPRTRTWFPNAHSIYDSTSRAVPAIMDGNYPVKDSGCPPPPSTPTASSRCSARATR